MVMVNVTLTPEERTILYMLAKGLFPKEIRIRLEISDNVYKQHLRYARIRLNANSTLRAVALALDKGLISLRDG
jgi:DNA-binding CsgD family transcriptional regulator